MTREPADRPGLASSASIDGSSRSSVRENSSNTCGRVRDHDRGRRQAESLRVVAWQPVPAPPPPSSAGRPHAFASPPRVQTCSGGASFEARAGTCWARPGNSESSHRATCQRLKPIEFAAPRTSWNKRGVGLARDVEQRCVRPPIARQRPHRTRRCARSSTTALPRAEDRTAERKLRHRSRGAAG